MGQINVNTPSDGGGSAAAIVLVVVVLLVLLLLVLWLTGVFTPATTSEIFQLLGV
jgi:formiminotetrahydrofolate cyclodeaminase